MLDGTYAAYEDSAGLCFGQGTLVHLAMPGGAREQRTPFFCTREPALPAQSIHMQPHGQRIHRRIDLHRVHVALGGRGRPPGTEILERSVHEAAGEVEAILAACDAAGPDGVGRVSAAGLMAELTGNPRRRVRLWIAAAAGYGAIGLASLTQTTACGGGAGGPGRMSVGWLIVAPSHRRSGLGLALLGEVATAAFQSGAEQVHAEVHPRWESARRFWDRVEALAADASVP